jgi:hypothetical protein
MMTLKTLGVKKHWLYETIISSSDASLFHAAPFGIKILDFQKIAINMFKGSKSLDNILKSGEFAINTMDDPRFFYDALWNKKSLKFARASKICAPVLVNAQASIEVRVIDTRDRGKSCLVTAGVVHVEVRTPGELINRAKSLVLESLIMATRLSLVTGTRLEKMIRENYRVVKKVAPGSVYEETMSRLIKDCCCKNTLTP